MTDKNNNVILVVDDDLITAVTIKKVLEKQGYMQVGVAGNADDAISFVNSSQPCLIIMDVNLRGSIDGIETSEKILATNDIPILFLTAYSDDETINRAKKINPYGYIIKPFDNRELITLVDITLYKHSMEKKLRENENKYRLLAENMIDMVATHLPDGTYTYISPSVEYLLGYSPDELTGTNPYNLFHPDDIHNIKTNAHEKVISGDHTSEIEYRIRQKNGNYIWFSTKAKPIIDSQNNIVSIQTVSRNISEKKLIQKNLNDFFEQSLNIHLMANFEGIIIRTNEAWENILGYDQNDLIGEHINKFIHPDDLHQTNKEMLKLADGINTFYFENRYKHKNGYYRLFAWSATANIEQKIIYAIANDITELRNTQNILIQNEKKFRSYIENAPNGIFIADQNGYYVEINPAACEITGYDADELIGSHLISMIPESHHQSAKEHFQKVILNGRAKGEIPFIRKDGSQGYWNVDAVKLDDNTFLGFVVDITEKKKYENELLENTKYFHSIIETSQDGFWIVDKNKKLIEVNQAYLDLTGYSREEFLSFTINDIDVIESIEGTIKRVNKIVSDGKALFETRHRCKDGSFIEVEVSVTYFKEKEQMVCFCRDITARKQIENNIRASEEKYRNIFESLQDVYYEVSIDGIILELSPSVSTLSKGCYKREDLIGKQILSLYKNPEMRDKFVSILIEGGSLSDFELDLINADGSTLHCSFASRAIYNEQGIAQKIIGTIRDISERIAAINLVTENELKYRTLVDNALEGILITDFDGIVLFANQAMANIIESPDPQLLINKNVFEMLSEESRERAIVDMIKVRDEQKVFIATYNGYSLKGKEIWVDTVGKKINYGSIEADLISVRDITERKKAQDALLAEKEFSESLIQTANVIVVGLDNNGNVEIFNQTAEQITGYTLAELRNRDWFEILVPKEKYPYVWEKFSKLGVEGFPKSFENPILTKNGEERIIQWQNSVLRRNNNIVGTISYGLDITERKRAETLLNEEYQKTKDILTSIPSGLFIYQFVEPDKLYLVSGNQEAETLTGINPDVWNSKEFNEIWPTAKESGITDKWLNVIYTNTNIEFEDIHYKDTRLTGAYRIRVFNIPGKKLGVAFEDISKFKKAQAELLESEEKFKTLAETANAINWEYDLTSDKWIYVSPQSVSILGYEPAEWENLGWWANKIHPDEREQIVSYCNNETLLSKDHRMEYRFLKKDGTYTWLDDMVRVIHYENKTILRGLLIDISKRKLSEQIISENENKYRNLFENSPISLWEEDFSEVKKFINNLVSGSNDRIETILNKENIIRAASLVKITDVNRTTVELFEAKDKTEITGSLDKLFIDDSLTVFKHELISLFNNKTSFYSEIKGKTLKGKILSFIMEVVLVPGFEETWGKVLVSILDITQRKQAEKAVIENQRLSAIGEMASSAAHDFNNSLQTIFGNLELALLNQYIPDNVRNYLEIIKTAASDAATRVQLLQRFGGNKQLSSTYEIVDLNQIIDDVIIQSRPIWKDNAEKSGINIKIERLFTPAVKVAGNDGELRSVVFNLIKNSVEAMPAGGTISIKTNVESGFAKISLTDSGIGMPPEVQARIFQPFFTTKGFELGRGLGMSGAYSIIKEHGGSINIIKSVPGEGTTIEIKIPQALASTPEKSKPEIGKAFDGKAHILWVDDDKMIRELALNIITALGHSGDVAQSGDEALVLLDQNNYDLVITDIGMPGMSGWELASKIREKFSGKMKVAVQTGWGDQINDEKKKEFGVGYVLTKPFKVNQVKVLINEALHI